MQPISGFYGFGNCSDHHGFSYLQGLASMAAKESGNGGSLLSSTTSTAEAKALAASKSHSEAERRRRKRINGHLATLRTLVPNTVKNDKASLLAEVVRRVRELKTAVTEMNAEGRDGRKEEAAFPSEMDELRVERVECDGAVKASLCCEDRAGLVSDLTRALRAARGKVVRAEMATVGGRTKSVVWVQGLTSAGSASGGGGEEGMETLRRALRVVIDRAPSSSGPGQGLPGNKRPRVGPC